MPGNKVQKFIALVAFTLASGLPVFANETVKAACEADTSERWNCGCVSDEFSKMSAGMTPEQTSVLAGLTATMFGDTEAGMRVSDISPMTMMSVADKMENIATLGQTCLSGAFTRELKAAEEEVEEKVQLQDDLQSAEEARTAAIPTAPAPPEITDPENHPALAGSAGVDAATEFRDYMIADCRSFGNSPGYCGCYADETEKMMTPERTRAYVVTSRVNREVDQGRIAIVDMDDVIAARLGVTIKDVNAYRAQWNAMVQSQAYSDIHFACDDYQ
jgi:hypothetical protein